MSQRAVLVGCNYSGTSNRLNGCINDVYNVKTILTTIYGFHPENIVIMTDDQPLTSPTYPSKNNILTAYNNAVNQTMAGDVLVLTFSGHGSNLHSQISTDIELTGNMDVIIPADVLNKGYFDQSCELSGSELYSVVCQAPVNSEVFCLIDACFSGHECQLPYLLQCSDAKNFSLKKVENRRDTTNCAISLSGCSETQTSADGWDSTGRPAGALTASFCEYIAHNYSQNISYADLLTNVRVKISQKYGAGCQTPQLCLGRMEDLGRKFTLSPNGVLRQLSEDNRQEVIKFIHNKCVTQWKPETKSAAKSGATTVTTYLNSLSQSINNTRVSRDINVLQQRIWKENPTVYKK